MIMKEYKYVEVKSEAKGVLFHSASEPKEIINKYAKEGYSYVQILLERYAYSEISGTFILI